MRAPLLLLLSLGASHATPDGAPCSPSPPRARAVYLAYTWGSGPSSCSPYFVRSWIALPPSERANALWRGSSMRRVLIGTGGEGCMGTRGRRWRVVGMCDLLRLRPRQSSRDVRVALGESICVEL